MSQRGYRFFICDVFTASRFGGNPLAVLPEADGLGDAEMQQIAREFNYSESTFVLPGNGPLNRRVRIFTPTTEVPFAGHPTIGTAFALAQAGEFGALFESLDVHFDVAAGRVPVLISAGKSGTWCELQAPQPLSTGTSVAPARIAAALSLATDDIVTDTHEPVVASVGLPFLIVEVAGIDALRRARAQTAALEALHDDGIVPDVHVYTRSDDEFDLRARMFAPLDGVPEDPATGSANCALAALLASRNEGADGEHRWRIAQGVEMGRPSVLDARTRRNGGEVTTWIGGSSVHVAEGTIFLDQESAR
ncbi:MAG: PhzF family phenazine biosynthesis protein [Woeseiaceae bacterium]|nr:PhzF family phenazine biosynthesis protein [Woeseiaceae bacterium]